MKIGRLLPGRTGGCPYFRGALVSFSAKERHLPAQVQQIINRQLILCKSSGPSPIKRQYQRNTKDREEGRCGDFVGGSQNVQVAKKLCPEFCQELSSVTRGGSDECEYLYNSAHAGKVVHLGASVPNGDNTR